MLEVYGLRCNDQTLNEDVSGQRLHFGWKLRSDRRNVIQQTYQIQIAQDEAFDHCVCDTGVVRSDNSANVTAEAALKPVTTYYFRVMVSDQYESSEWAASRFSTTTPCFTADFITAKGVIDNPENAMMARQIHIGKPVRQARLFVSALGLYTFYVNDQRVGHDLLTPGFTEYDKRLLFQSYDVTDMLKPGENWLGAMLAEGWYKGKLGFENQKCLFGDTVALICELHILYADGGRETVKSGRDFYCASSPVLFSGIYDGETYDARLEKPFRADEGWKPVAVYPFDKGILRPHDGEKVRERERFRAKELIITPKGERVIDFGQNIAGYVELTTDGQEGERIVFTHAEVLDAQGNFYTDNLRTAKQRIEYIIRKGRQAYKPRFTFQGFRYIRLDECPKAVRPEDFTAVAIYSDMAMTGEFECSDPLLNRLWQNIGWSMRGNFVDIPTDCPQRDERMGWTGDAQVFIPTANCLMDTRAFFRKWLADLDAAQHDNGAVPHVVPDILKRTSSDYDPHFVMGENAHSSCGWGDAITVCPYEMYLSYGDRDFLESRYPAMKKWVDYIRSVARGGLIWDSGHHFGDWVALDAEPGSFYGATPNEFTASAYYARSAEIAAKAARILNRETDAREYAALHRRIVKAIRRRFVGSDGMLGVNTQTAFVLALCFDLISKKDRAKNARALNEMVLRTGHMTTGFLGTPLLCFALSRFGFADTAYRLVRKQDYPSWLYQITKGATTIWEHLDGIRPDGTMWSPDMNSFNHYAYGAVGQWLFQEAAGIRIDESRPAYKNVIIAPKMGGGLTYIRASIETVYGRVAVDIRGGDDALIRVCVPPNAAAKLELFGCEFDLVSGEHEFA